MEEINTRVVRLSIRPRRRTAMAVVELHGDESPLLEYVPALRLRVEMLVKDHESMATLCDRACAQALAYFDDEDV